MTFSSVRLAPTTLMLVTLLLPAVSAEAGLMATLSVERTTPELVGPGETVRFNIWLRDLMTNQSTDVVEAFFLDFTGSDAALTANLSSFHFQLAPTLAGVLGGLVLDDDASDDGVVGFGADTFFSTETGFGSAFGDQLLGELTLTAPSPAGQYTVSLAQNDVVPFAATNLFVNDGSLFGVTLPGDGTLRVTGSDFVVRTPGNSTVPEPSSFLISAVLGSVVLLRAKRRR